MGKISDTGLYPFDTAITPNDYVIGTDGDNAKATKNYKVSKFLDYLGTQFNLQNQDLYYTYNAVASGSVGTGEMSSNNFGDVNILMSGVTNLYVSKLTVLGALVETYLNAIAADAMTIILMDLTAPENYGVFTISGAADVDANTIDLTVTVSDNNGELISGRSVGLKLTAGSGDGTGFVDLTTNQTVGGQKTFTDLFRVNATTTITTSPYTYYMNASGFRVVSSNVVSPNTGGFYIRELGGEYALYAPDGTLGSSTQKILFENVDNVTTPTLTAATVVGQLAVTDDPYSFSWDGNLQVPTKNAVYDQFQNILSNDPYGAGWNNSLTGASRNAIYDKIEAMISDLAYVESVWNGIADVAPSKNAVRDALEAIVNSVSGSASWIAPTTNTLFPTTPPNLTINHRFVFGETGSRGVYNLNWTCTDTTVSVTASTKYILNASFSAGTIVPLDTTAMVVSVGGTDGVYSGDIEHLIAQAELYDAGAGTARVRVFLEIAFATGGTKDLTMVFSGAAAI